MSGSKISDATPSTPRDAVVVRAEELRELVGFDLEALAAVEESFVWASSGRATMPPIQHIEVGERGDVDVKSAYVRGKDSFAIKIAAGFYGNAADGLPTGSGLMVVLSARTGFCEAVLLDNGYLTDLRTALAGAVAAKHLAPTTVETAGVVGTGVQARMQIEALRLVRDFRRLMVWGRDRSKAEAYAREMGERLGVDVEVAATVDELVRASQVVVTTTPSRAPLVTVDALHLGLHVTAMGSDLAGKQELAVDVLRRADLVACDSRRQVATFGESQHLRAEEIEGNVELGEIIAGEREGRRSDGDVTVCDLTGMGTQDTAIALLALERRLVASGSS